MKLRGIMEVILTTSSTDVLVSLLTGLTDTIHVQKEGEGLRSYVSMYSTQYPQDDVTLSFWRSLDWAHIPYSRKIQESQVS
jgi:hypothetical protein